MTAVVAKLLADLRRRRLQGGVIALIVLLASGTAALALTLRTAAANPYDRAFAAQRGAHLAVVFDGRVVAPDRLARTPGLLGASAWAGPWPTTGINVRASTGSVGRFSLNVQGRADPGGDIERLRLAAGRWPTGPGQIVLTRSLAEQQGLSPGDRLVDMDVPTRPTLEVVGEVIDVDEGEAGLASQSAWVLPAQVAPLVGQGHYLGYRVAYRLPGRPTQTDLRRATARLEAALPAGAVSDTMSYLEVKKLFTLINTIILTFLLAFSVFALGAAAAVTANVVAGAVLASYRDIGIMKALGYTPAQVVGTLTGAMLVPALAGSVIGIPLGTLLAQPLLGRSSHALGLPSHLAFWPAVDLLTLAGVLVAVTAAAMLPALRAGRLSPVRVLVLGAGPERSGNPRTRRPRRRLGPPRRPGPPRGGRLGLPRPLSLGAADAFARPLRGTLTVTAVLIGVATMTFAFGQHRSLDRFHRNLATAQVQVQRTAAYPDSTLMRTLLAQPETAGVVATSSAHMLVPGLTDPVLVKAFRGNPADLGVPLVKGRWYAEPGEVVIPNGLLQQTHLHVGDLLTVTFQGRAIPLRIVGSDFDVSNFGRDLSVDWSTLERVVPDAQPLAYLVRLRTSADPAAYARRIQATAPDFLSTQSSSPIVSLFGIFDLVGLTLVVVLAGIAVAGIFATVLLNTRERLHDTAVLRVLGMTPRQILAMATASACTLGLAGGVLGVPAGIALHQAVETLAGSVIGNRIPAATLETFPLLVMPALALTGMLLAMVGALLPAWWAARGATVEPLRAE
jgi:putative ABC transport system permease protein